jgi:hypothetical protein
MRAAIVVFLAAAAFLAAALLGFVEVGPEESPPQPIVVHVGAQSPKVGPR